MTWSLNSLHRRAIGIIRGRTPAANKDDKSSSGSSQRQSRSSSSPENQRHNGASNASIQDSIQSGPMSRLDSEPQQSTKSKKKGKPEAKTKINNASPKPNDSQLDSSRSAPAREIASSKQSPILGFDIRSDTLDFPSRKPTIISHRGSKHTHTFILLHDCNSHGNDLAKNILSNKKSRTNQTLAEIFPSMRFVFPNARLACSSRHKEGSVRSTTVSPGVVPRQSPVPQWFDVRGFQNPSPGEEKEIICTGLRESICDIADIIMSEASIVGIENIVLGGIGQGAATAIMALLIAGQNLGAFVGLGGWMPFRDETQAVVGECYDDRGKIQSQVERILGMETGEVEEYEELEEEYEEDGEDSTNDIWNENFATKQNREKPVVKTPIFLSHAEDDEVVPYRLGKEMRRTLNSLGFQGHWQKSEGGQGINEGRCIDDMADFLEAILDIKGRSSTWYDDKTDELEASGLASNLEKIRRLLEERK